MTTAGLPEGAEEIPFVGYNHHIGPLYGLPDQGLHRFCFQVVPHHMNAAGTVHGGMLMSLADIAMSRAARAGTEAQNSSTVSLSCDFVGPGKLGEVIEARVRVTRRTRTIVFLSADIVSDGRTLLVASGVWKIMIPPGYRQTSLADPFEIHLGPIHETGDAPERCFALLIDARHVNRRQVMHGGMMMTYADATLGALAADLSGGVMSVTLNMQSQFLAPAKLGRIIEVKPELTRRTRSMLFIRGDFTVDGEIVMTASSVWKLLGQG